MQVALHRILLAAGIGVVVFIPKWVTGLPLSQLLSSDAESWVYQLQKVELEDKQQVKSKITKPNTAYYIPQLRAIIEMGKITGLSVVSISVYTSIFCLIIWVFTFYEMAKFCLPDPRWAILPGMLSIIETHILGGSTLGFRALGFMPRDLASVIALLLVTLYVVGASKRRGMLIISSFVGTGLLFYLYPPQSVVLFLVLAIADILREKKISLILACSVAGYLLVCSQYAVELVNTDAGGSFIDINIMRARNKFMLVTGFNQDSLRYLRRFGVHSLICFVSIRMLFNKYKTKPNIVPIIYISISGFLLAVMGLIIESNTEYLRLFISRASAYLTIGTLILCTAVLSEYVRDKITMKKTIVVCGVILALLVQTNLTTLIRYWTQIACDREEIRAVMQMSECIKRSTGPASLLLVPYTEQKDIAATIRTYSEREVYVCDKEGGVSLVDGKTAREWNARVQKQKNVLKTSDTETLSKFMFSEKISYILFRSSDPFGEAAIKSAQFELICSNAYLSLIKRRFNEPFGR